MKNDFFVSRGGGSSEPGGGGSRELHEAPLESRQECHTKILSGCHNQKNCQRLPKRGIARIPRNKIVASEYNNQKY